MSATELRAAWLEHHGSDAPRLSSELLTRGLAYRLLEKRAGGLSASTLRQLRLLAGGKEVEPPRTELRPGTQLVRSWHGRTITATVEEGGFLFEGRHYRSLSQIAREVTGAGWSGPRFFGLTARSKG